MKPDGDDLYQPESSATATAVAEPPPAPVEAPISNSAPAQPPVDGGTITWTASEYIHHDRGAGWYGALFLGTIALAGGVYLLTKDYFATGAIVVVGAIVGAFAGRKPSQVTYELSSSGLRVGQKMYAYGLFKSFSIIRSGQASSISLLPLKRLMPPVDAYFGPADEEKITDVLGQHLPFEERKQAGIDRLSYKLRF